MTHRRGLARLYSLGSRGRATAPARPKDGGFEQLLAAAGRVEPTEPAGGNQPTLNPAVGRPFFEPGANVEDPSYLRDAVFAEANDGPGIGSGKRAPSRRQIIARRDTIRDSWSPEEELARRTHLEGDDRRRFRRPRWTPPLVEMIRGIE